MSGRREAERALRALRPEVIDALRAASGGEEAVLAFDLGGTKLRAGAFDAAGRIVWRASAPTRKGIEKIYGAYARMVMRAARALGRAGYRIAPRLATGTPGRYLEDGSIAPGTARNLGRTDHEFDGVRPAGVIGLFLPRGFRVVVVNDAVAQMAYAVSELWRRAASRRRIAGRKVAYIGPGTGLGGGFARVLRTGGIRIHTDGHIFDILIEDETGRAMIAEDRVSGRAIREATGRTGRYVAEHLERYRRRVRRMGRDLGRLVEAIHEGRIRKPDPGARWPAKDLRWVRGIDRFIIGGSIGTKGAMGRLIRSEARRHLRARGLGHLVFLTFAADSDDAGLLGAYQFVKALRGC